MKYIHIRNLERFHPGYKDRQLLWAKIHFSIIQGDPEIELIKNEIDKWRFVGLICLELRAQKPLPDDEKYWRKHFDIKNRPMSKTLNVLHNFIEVVTEDSQSCTPEKSRVEKRRGEESGRENVAHPTDVNVVVECFSEIINRYSLKMNPTLEAHKFFDHFTSNGWKVSGKTPMNDWKASARNWIRNAKTWRNNGTGDKKQSESQPFSVYNSMTECPKCLNKHNEKNCPACGTPKVTT